MTGPLYHLGRFCARHHWLVIAAWIVAAVGLAFMGRAAGHHTSDDLTLPGTDSTKATDVLEKRLPDQAYGSNPLALVSTTEGSPTRRASRPSTTPSSRCGTRRTWSRR
jgi:putative drug exporter of the RND superfamily